MRIAKQQLRFVLIALVAFAGLFVWQGQFRDALNGGEVYPPGFLEILDKPGHAIERHVEKSDEYLKARLENEPDISAASTFLTMDEAEQAVRHVLTERADLIAAWLNKGKSGRKAFYAPVNGPVGRIFMRGADRPVAGNSVRVVLIRELTTPYKFAILTAYPEYRDDKKNKAD